MYRAITVVRLVRILLVSYHRFVARLRVALCGYCALF